jgi:hypothetical protein
VKQQLITGTTFLWRTLWRLLVLVLVVGLAYASTFILLPFLDRRLPIFPALVILYLIIAYIGIPIIIRVWRLVFKPNHIPRYVTTPDGWPADPVNIAIVAKNKRQLISYMRRAGWYTADKSSFRTLMREAYAIVFAKPYNTAPFSALYLFGRKFDIGFQIPYGRNGSPRHRHHVRFWQLIEKPHIDKSNHFSYWLERVRRFFGRKRTVWIGAAIDDTSPTGVRWRNLQITHQNDPEHTKERDLIIATLKRVGLVKRINTIRDGEPFKMRSQNIGTTFIVDGNIKVVELKSPLVKAVQDAVKSSSTSVS